MASAPASARRSAPADVTGRSGLLLGPVLIGALATLFGLKASLWLLVAGGGFIALTANSMRDKG